MLFKNNFSDYPHMVQHADLGEFYSRVAAQRR